MTLGSNWQLWTNAANVTQNGDGSVTIAGGGNGYNAQIATATPNGSGSLNGQVFGGGGYFEATLSFVGTPVTNGGWPSFWANDIENQINAQTGNGASQWRGPGTGTSTRSKLISWSIWLGKVRMALPCTTGMASRAPFRPSIQRTAVRRP